MFHVEHSEAPNLEHLSQDDEPAPQTFDEGPSSLVDQWRGNQRRGLGTRRAPEQ